MAVIHEADRFGVRSDFHNRDNRTESLFIHDAHVVGYVCEEGRGHVVSLRRGASEAGVGRGGVHSATGDGVRDVLLDALFGGVGDDGTHGCGWVGRIA